MPSCRYLAGVGSFPVHLSSAYVSHFNGLCNCKLFDAGRPQGLPLHPAAILHHVKPLQLEVRHMASVCYTMPVSIEDTKLFLSSGLEWMASLQSELLKDSAPLNHLVSVYIWLPLALNCLVVKELNRSILQFTVYLSCPSKDNGD